MLTLQVPGLQLVVARYLIIIAMLPHRVLSEVETIFLQSILQTHMGLVVYTLNQYKSVEMCNTSATLACQRDCSTQNCLFSSASRFKLK